MIARFASIALAGALALGIPATAFAQNGYGSAASVAASIGATASPPFAGDAVPVIATHPPDAITGSIERLPRSYVRKPRR